jgi:ribosomal protein L16/L10AE
MLASVRQGVSLWARLATCAWLLSPVMSASLATVSATALPTAREASTHALSHLRPATIAAEITCTDIYRQAHGGKEHKVPFKVTGPLLPESKTRCGLGKGAPGVPHYRVSTVDPNYVLVSVYLLDAKGRPNSDAAPSIVNVATRSVLAHWQGLPPCPRGEGGGTAAVPGRVLKGFGIPRC